VSILVIWRRRLQFLLPSLRYWRIQRGLTQEHLAERIAVRRTTVGRIETGGPCFRRTAHLLAEALGVQTADLMSRPPGGLAAV
jgi:DNA-binding XRE family transcriptional regulator